MVVPHGGPSRLLGGWPPPAAEGQVLPPPEVPGEQEEGRVDTKMMNTAEAQALTPFDATRRPRGVEGPDVSTASPTAAFR